MITSEPLDQMPTPLFPFHVVNTLALNLSVCPLWAKWRKAVPLMLVWAFPSGFYLLSHVSMKTPWMTSQLFPFLLSLLNPPWLAPTHDL